MRLLPLRFFLFCFITLLSVNIQNHTVHAAKKAEWTILVFLNGHNNLDRFGYLNMNQMEQVGSNQQLNIVVQWASIREGKVQRLLVKKDESLDQVTSPMIQDLGRADMGDWKQLVEFIAWGVKNYPAKHYFVDVWNHGNGWKKDELEGPTRDISYDDYSGNKITTEQLGLALAQAKKIMGQKVDIYGSDACLMAMAEVAGEMYNNVKYFIGSQDLEPGEGWPYHTFLAPIAANPKLKPLEVSKILVEEYAKAYSPGGVYRADDVTLSAFDIDRVRELDFKLKALGLSIANKLSTETKQKILQDMRTSRRFYDYEYTDLGDFISRIAALNIKEIKKDVQNVQKELGRYVVANRATQKFEGSSGVSVWVPSSRNSYYMDRYTQLGFPMRSRWLSFVTHLMDQ